jgi:hypothetical protein
VFLASGFPLISIRNFSLPRDNVSVKFLDLAEAFLLNSEKKDISPKNSSSTSSLI